MPASRGGRLRRKGCSLARRTQRQATAAWRLLYRLLFMVSRASKEQVNIYKKMMLFMLGYWMQFMKRPH